MDWPTLFGVIKKAAAAAIEASQYLAPRDSATVTDEQRDGFDAEDAAKAHQYIHDGKNTGKVLLRFK